MLSAPANNKTVFGVVVVVVVVVVQLCKLFCGRKLFCGHIVATMRRKPYPDAQQRFIAKTRHLIDSKADFFEDRDWRKIQPKGGSQSSLIKAVAVDSFYVKLNLLFEDNFDRKGRSIGQNTSVTIEKSTLNSIQFTSKERNFTLYRIV